MKKMIVAVLAVMMALMADFAAAQSAPAGGTAVNNPGTKMPVARRRVHRQNRRIVQGVKSGEITKEEGKELAKDRKELRKEVKDAKSDGTVTKEERIAVQKKLNENSKAIYDAKHNDAKRPVAVPTP